MLHVRLFSVSCIQVVCESSLQGLEKLLFQSSVLPGGGCWQVLLAQYLTEQVSTSVSSLLYFTSMFVTDNLKMNNEFS